MPVSSALNSHTAEPVSMQSSPGAVAAASAQLAQLRAAAAELAASVSQEDSGSPVTAPVEDPDAEWESRLAAVNAAIGAALQPGSPAGGGGGVEEGGGNQLAPHQAELVEAINACPGNCVAFLPLGRMRDAAQPASCCPGIQPPPSASTQCPLCTRRRCC